MIFETTDGTQVPLHQPPFLRRIRRQAGLSEYSKPLRAKKRQRSAMP